MSELIEFKAIIKRCVYNSPTFKVYASEVNQWDYPDIKTNEYGNVSLSGEIPDLTTDVEYTVKAEETQSKYGIGYKVKNITRELPTNEEDTRMFLEEILTKRQADTLLNSYPNIIDLVRNGKDSEVDLSKLSGIGEYTFNIIKNKIIENFCLMELVIEFKNVLTLSMIKKIYDRYTSIDVLKQKLKESPYKTLTRISGIGFKTADVLILNLQKQDIIDFGYDILTSVDRCIAFIIYELEENQNNGNTKMSLVDLRKSVFESVPECSDKFTEAIKDDAIYYNKTTLDVALNFTYNTEKFISEDISKRLTIDCDKWDYDIEKYRTVDGFDLSDEQMVLLDSVCKNNITLLTAPAGTGKSASTKALINMLDDNKKRYILCSPTGKAAKKLSEYTNRNASTIHRTLGFNPIDGFMCSSSNQLFADVVVVDEMGMVDVFLFRHLLDAIGYKTKIVIIGDSYQLPSVGAGNVLSDLINSKLIPTVILTKVFRLGKGGALTACTYVRNKHKFISENTMNQLGEDKSYTFIPVSKEIVNNYIVQLYKKLLSSNELSDITVISSYNVGENGCQKLNKLLQPIANPNAKENNPHITIKQNKEFVNFYMGDLVIQNVNNYHAENNDKKDIFIPNGTQGVVTAIDESHKKVYIQFEDIDVIYSYNDLANVKHAFALSVHKMQGSQNKHIIFCCPSSHIFMLNNNLMYTALSRAEKYIYHLSDAKTINVAMNKSENISRQTFLKDMLMDINTKHE